MVEFYHGQILIGLDYNIFAYYQLLRKLQTLMQIKFPSTSYFSQPRFQYMLKVRTRLTRTWWIFPILYWTWNYPKCLAWIIPYYSFGLSQWLGDMMMGIESPITQAHMPTILMDRPPWWRQWWRCPWNYLSEPSLPNNHVRKKFVSVWSVELFIVWILLPTS